MTTNKDKQREVFEKWASVDFDVTTLEDGSYLYEEARWMWKAWQASQQTIRLPDEKDWDWACEQEHAEGWNDCRAEVIRLNGLGDK